MQETRDKGSIPGKIMATHSSFLARRIASTEEAGGLQSMGRRELDTPKVTEHARR